MLGSSIASGLMSFRSAIADFITCCSLGIGICPEVWKLIQSVQPMAHVPLLVPNNGDDEPLMETPSYAPDQLTIEGVHGLGGHDFLHIVKPVPSKTLPNVLSVAANLPFMQTAWSFNTFRKPGAVPNLQRHIAPFTTYSSFIIILLYA